MKCELLTTNIQIASPAEFGRDAFRCFTKVKILQFLTSCVCFLSQQLKQQRDKLRQYQKRINLQLEKERLLAKQLLKNGKKE